MAKLNTPVLDRPVTHEGAPAWQHTSAEQALRRSVLSCLLWENEFYEDGKSIADRITKAAEAVPVNTLAELVIEARSKYNLRHVPLLLLTVLARRGRGQAVGETIAATIQRADELAEFLAVYAQANGVSPDKLKPKLSAQVKKGLALAFGKFDAYRLAKYNRPGAIKLRDVLFLCHAKPKDDEQAELWKKLIDGTLESPDTWEVALSGGADKKETFERLLREGNLGYLALLRNLRNMSQADCDSALVKKAIIARKGGAERVLPFRYVAAARAVPKWEKAIDTALQAAIADLPELSGQTIVLVDVSGSMDVALSGKSDLARIDAAAALAAIVPGDVRVFTFSNAIVEVPPRRGMAGVDAVIRSQDHGGTYLGAAVGEINKLPHDRLIVISDEQSHDPVPAPKAKHAYMINVASNENGIGYGKWTHIDGFSERVLTFIREFESVAGTQE
jgi:60 kDa SS-A/Ro ribonucleoprotein